MISAFLNIFFYCFKIYKINVKLFVIYIAFYNYITNNLMQIIIFSLQIDNYISIIILSIKIYKNDTYKYSHKKGGSSVNPDPYSRRKNLIIIMDALSLIF